MMGAVLEIPRIKWEKQRSLGLDKGFRDATRDYLKWRWPNHTAKYAAREFDLSVDQGRSAANGTPSLTTIERILKNGGPLVALHILERMGVKLAELAVENSMQGAALADEHERSAASAYRALAGNAGGLGADGNRAPAARQARRSA